MGLFFNYDKPGPGVEKDGPKKKGIFLYMELFWRKLGKIFLSNMLYVLVSLPVVAIYNVLAFYILSALVPSEAVDNNTGFIQAIFMMTAVLTIFWGTGPISCGYAFLMRNFAREEHVWLLSDFFEHTKKNFKQSIIIFAIDIFVLFTGVNAIYFYWKMAETVVAFKYLSILMLMLMMIYTFMHFYMYEFLVTFKVSVKDVFKNSAIMAIAAFPMNLILAAFVLVCTYFFFSFLTPIAIIIAFGLFWVSFMRFPIDFFAARFIKREIIDRKERDE